MSSSMAWKEVSPGRWSRPLDSIESFFHTACNTNAPSGAAHCMVLVGVTLPAGANYSNETVKAAWKSLRYFHPHIASSIIDGCVHYSIPTENELEEWFAQTLQIIDSSETSTPGILSKLKPLQTGTLVYLRTTRNICFQIPHSHIDGVGAMSFMEILLKTLRNPPGVRFGDEHRNLTDSIAHVLRLGPPTDLDLHLSRKIVRNFTSGLPGITFQMKSPTGPSYSVRSEQARFTSFETASIRSKSRSLGITVTHACHSSMIQAAHQVAGADSTTYPSLFFVDLRERFDSRCNGTVPPVSVYLTALPASIRTTAHGDFLERAQHLKKVYMRFRNNTTHVRFHEPIYKLMNQSKNGDESKNIFLSSLGIVERQIACKVDDFWVGVTSATVDITMYVWTFKDCLTMTVWYNEGFHEQEKMVTFLQQMQSNLLIGLGLSGSVSIVS